MPRCSLEIREYAGDDKAIISRGFLAQSGQVQAGGKHFAFVAENGGALLVFDESVAIVTAADEGFKPFLWGCLGSIFAHELEKVAKIVVFDCGLHPDTIQILERHGVTVKPAPAYKIAVPGLPDHFRAATLRPYLSSILSDTDYIWWIDADAWIQDKIAFDAYLEAARTHEFVCCVEADRNYSNYYGTNLHDPLLFADTCGQRSFFESWGRIFGRFVDQDIASRLAMYPMINSGVFCARTNSRLWSEWERYLEEMMSKLEQNLLEPTRRKSDLLVEQTALNAAVRQSNIRTNFLPATYNWTCHMALPLFDSANGKLCERNWPFEPLKVVHLTTPAIKQGETQLELLDRTAWGGRHSNPHTLRSPYGLPLN